MQLLKSLSSGFNNRGKIGGKCCVIVADVDKCHSVSNGKEKCFKRIVWKVDVLIRQLQVFYLLKAIQKEIQESSPRLCVLWCLECCVAAITRKHLSSVFLVSEKFFCGLIHRQALRWVHWWLHAIYWKMCFWHILLFRNFHIS